ncbi:hypothetical protein F53441_6366 [Fusarium austroafricanum]|uniref:Uncharacterized protein n=1 Tax=Fusarium austroafricanum TaxID=2364996 RepID=A0A8H4NZM2_9HYPO|nr:hypothetical protein F53441_6366 [Fusarium austroafricanum]
MKLYFTIVFLLQLASAANTIRWTLHRNCYENDLYRESMIRAVETAKSRSAFAASKIKSLGALDLLNSFRRLANLLVTFDGLKTLGARYEKFAGVEGPIGANSGFADSPEWTGRSNPSNIDFVIYCAPDLARVPDYPEFTYDRAKMRVLASDNPLLQIQKDIEANKFADKEKINLAVTFNAPSTMIENQEEAAKIPDTITVNPVWMATKNQEGELFSSDEKFEKMKKKGALAELKKEWKGDKKATPVDKMFNDLAGTIHHEMFHLSAFGAHLDLPEKSPKAYNWMYNVEMKILDNPELMALLALIFDLKENKKVMVNKDGELK